MEKSNDKLIKVISCLFFSILLIVSILCVIGLSIGTKYKKSLFNEQAFDLNDGWTMAKPDGEITQVELPYNMKFDNPGKYSFSHTIGEEFYIIESPVVMLVANHVKMDVYIGDNLVYTSQKDGIKLMKADGHTFHFIRLGANDKGQTLKIENEILLNDGIQYIMYAPKVGSKATILVNTFWSDSFSLLIGSLAILIGAIVLLVGIFSKIKHKYRIIFSYVSSISILFGLYITFETNFFHLVFNNNYILHILTFTPIMIIPIPALILLQKFSTTKMQYISGFLNIVVVLNAIIQLILSITKISDFREMLPITHIIIIFAAVVCIITLFKENSYTMKQKIRIIIVLTPVILGVVIDIIIMYLIKASKQSLFTQIGIVITTSLFTIVFASRMLQEYRSDMEAEYYRNMAFKDALTGIKNRNSYQEYNELLDNNIINNSPLWCISIDINNLKDVNDNYGHKSGDDIIITLAISLIRTIGKKGEVFRIGGDEFCCYVVNEEFKEIKDMLEQLRKEVSEFNLNHEYKLSYAVGVQKYDKETMKSVHDLTMKADKLMYTDKQRCKMHKDVEAI